MSDGSKKAVGTGRGLMFISAAKLWFMVAGYVVQFGLPRALGSPEKWGIWVVVLSLVSPVNNVMVTATIQGVSKFCSEAEGRTSAVTRAALRMQVWLGGGIALAFVVLAPLVAWFEHDPSLTPHLQLAAGVVLAYAFYAVFVGAANGARAFHKQAALDITFSTLRATLVVGAGVLAHSVMAALSGFVAAAVTILFVSILVVGVGPRPSEAFPARKLSRFFFGVATYLLIVNLLMFVDGLLLKRLVAEAAARAGAADPNAVANAQEGFYGAVQSIARIPYQLILAVTFVIFPIMSRATFDKDEHKARAYVAVTMRYSLVVVALLAATLGARPYAAMRLLYRPEYAVGSRALVALIAGYVCFSLFNVAGTVINSTGRTRPTTAIGLLSLAACTLANWFAITWALATGKDPLLYAALATACGMAVGLVVAGAYLFRTFGAFLAPLTLARVGLAVLAAVAVGRAWPTVGFLGGKLGTLLSMCACGLAYLIVVVASGELRPAEIRRIRR